MFTVFLAALLFVGLCVLGLGVNIFFRKGGKFPQTDISGNDAMRRLATVYGKALSEYIRRRVLGRPMQPARPPLEGLPAVRRCAALLGHVARTGIAGAGAERLFQEARRKLLQLEGDAA